MRRTADGGAELITINGVAPSPPAVLPPDMVATRSRPGPTFEIGAMSAEGLMDVDVTEFYAEVPNGTTGVSDSEPPNVPVFDLISSNPVVTMATFRFSLLKATHSSLAIYDTFGRHIRTLVEGELHSGDYTVHWNGLDPSGTTVPGGIYFARLVVDHSQQVRKLVLVRSN
jgi:hypothetical protein